MDNALAAVIATVTAIIVLAIERRMDRVATNRELRRKALEEWLSLLTAWVDKHRNDEHNEAAKSLLQDYQQLTNRQVLELSFRRRDRYVAWWMHEMTLALLEKQPPEARTPHRDQVLQDTGENLLRWYHGELKSRDFEIPYAIRKEARGEGQPPQEIAARLGLSLYVEPQRMTRRREWHIAKLVSDPGTGKPLLADMGIFIGKKNAMDGFLLAILKARLMKLHLVLLKLGQSRTAWKLARLNRRFSKLQEEQARANAGLVEAREELTGIQEEP